jgi:hypothetical protein
MISDNLLKEISEINKLSAKLEKTKDAQNDYILHSMAEHAEEINELFRKHDDHWATETGDLLVHCIRLLVLNGYDVNELLEKIPGRFVKKINELILKKKSPNVEED